MSSTASPSPRRDRAELLRLLDQGRGMQLLLLAALLLGLMGMIWREALVLAVTGQDVQAEALERGTATRDGRVTLIGGRPGSGMAESYFVVRFRVVTPDGSGPELTRRVGTQTMIAAERGAILPARQSTLWPERYVTLEPGQAALGAAGWLGLVALSLAGLGWRRLRQGREIDRALVALSQGTEVAGRVVSHHRRKGQVKLAWRTAEGLSGTTLPLPAGEVVGRWPVTGPIRLWRHPDGRGRLWSEAERGG